MLDKAKADTCVAVTVHVKNLWKDVKRRSSKQHVRAALETCAFILRWQSNVWPRFFADCLKGAWAFPIVIEVNRIWRCLALLEVVSVSSVYLSFNFSMFAVDPPWHHIYKTTWSEVARTFYQGEQISVFVGHQQINDVWQSMSR